MTNRHIDDSLITQFFPVEPEPQTLENSSYESEEMTDEQIRVILARAIEPSCQNDKVRDVEKLHASPYQTFREVHDLTPMAYELYERASEYSPCPIDRMLQSRLMSDRRGRGCAN